MKIGIVTFHNTSNFGAAMQAFALRRFLCNMGHNVQIINYRNQPRQLTDNDLKNFPYWGKRWLAYQNFFVEHYNQTKVYSSIKDLRNANMDFDLVITGSDQIWSNFHSKLDPIYFADFVRPDTIRASYAASLGTSNLSYPGQRLVFQKYLRDYDYISIREDNFKDELERISGKPVEVTIDPTLILEKAEYKEFIKERPFESEYLYVHIHHHTVKDDLLVQMGKELSDQTKLPIVHNMLDVVFDNQLGNVYEYGVGETVNTIYHAKYVLTQSFHALSFSLIFQKNFFVLLKNNPSDERMRHLLTKLGLLNNLLSREKTLPVIADHKIDYTKVNANLWELKKKSIDYLVKITQGQKMINKSDYLTSQDQFSCCGCGACVDICPHHAIKFMSREGGFAYPLINVDKCTNCDLCHEVCPNGAKNNVAKYKPKAYLSFHKDDNILKNSSSGGMFPALAKAVLDEGGFVVGVRFNDIYEALYDIADNEKDCYAFRYSKYVEAQHNDIFMKTKVALETKKPVLFTGTPCKIAGLKNYLFGKSYDNLITVDIICYGVNSPLALKKYLEAKSKEANSTITHFQFRSPKKKSNEQATEFQYANGVTEVLSKTEDLFMRAFVKNLMLRKSCYCCEFCGNSCISDITIGDFWGWNAFYKGNVDNGVSALKVNTQKGAELFNKIKNHLFIQEQKVSDIYRRNHSYPSSLPVKRGWIMNELQKKNALSVFVEALK